MERLTERFENGQAAVLGCGNNCKYDYKYCNNYLEDCPTITEIYEKLAAYEDAEEQGRLVKLPCKVGDTVYHVAQGRIVEVSNVDLFFLLLSVVENRFNNSVFLTKEEAEAKLKELRCSND